MRQSISLMVRISLRTPVRTAVSSAVRLVTGSGDVRQTPTATAAPSRPSGIAIGSTKCPASNMIIGAIANPAIAHANSSGLAQMTRMIPSARLDPVSAGTLAVGGAASEDAISFPSCVRHQAGHRSRRPAAEP